MYEQQEQTSAAVTLFYSYAHQDERLREQLETHLSLLRRRGIISEWHDRKIAPGTNWTQAIDAHLMTAQIILLLISPDFLASDYCYGVELHQALERQETGEAIVIPLLLRPVDWEEAPFAHLQCLPRNGKPVTSWQDRDEAFATIARELRSLIEALPTTPHHVSQAAPPQRRNRMTARNQPMRSSVVPPDLNRQYMLDRVRRRWITGVLEHSLHGAMLIELGLEEQPSAVENPWRLSVQETELPDHPLPAGTTITQVYDEAEGTLLILGEPGAGKTTLLLDLTRQLLVRAREDEQEPIPVVFNLSSWAKKRSALGNWLVEELAEKYDIPPKLGTSWVSNERLLLLLDGLDEVAPEAREECIQAINQYHREHALVPIVVCSRRADYPDSEESIRLRLHIAVIIQPLTPEQVEQYLAMAGEQVAALRKALQHDADLRKLATTPLMLNVLLLAYQGKSLDPFPATGSLQSKQLHIFASYVERMLTRRGAQSHYAQGQTQQWLSWLARQMQQHNVTEFYLEQLQPTWLPTQQARQIYAQCIRQMFTLPIVLFFVLFFGLSFGLSFELLIFLLFFLLMWLLGSRQAAQSDARRQEIHPVEILIWSWKRFRLSLGNFLTVMPVIVLVGGPVAWLVSMPSSILFSILFSVLFSMLSSVLPSELVVYLLPWLPSVLYFVLYFVLYRRWQVRQAARSQETRPTAVLTWSWERFRLLLRYGLVGGLFFGMFFGMFFGFIGLFSGPGGVPTNLLLPILPPMLLFMLSLMLPFVLLSGLSNTQIDKEQRRRPNQGIRRSGWNALLSLLFSLPLSVLLGMLLSVLLGELSFIRFFIPLITLLVVLQAYGGRAYLQHYILRFLLWRSGAMPWHYVHFLDYAAERILLRKVGGGYIFTHPLLLEYFAALESSDRAAQPSSEPAMMSRPTTTTTLEPSDRAAQPSSEARPPAAPSALRPAVRVRQSPHH